MKLKFSTKDVARRIANELAGSTAGRARAFESKKRKLMKKRGKRGKYIYRGF